MGVVASCCGGGVMVMSRERTNRALCKSGAQGVVYMGGFNRLRNGEVNLTEQHATTKFKVW